MSGNLDKIRDDVAGNPPLVVTAPAGTRMFGYRCWPNHAGVIDAVIDGLGAHRLGVEFSSPATSLGRSDPTTPCQSSLEARRGSGHERNPTVDEGGRRIQLL